MFFRQEELTYAEDAQVKKCISKIAEISSGNVTLFDVIGSIYDTGLLEELFAVILKPDHRTKFHQIWNWWWARYYGITLHPEIPMNGRKPIIGLLKNSEIMEVLADFFVLNTNWMNGLENLKQVSISGS
ncbi:MAG: hypothetical protein ACHQQQ_00070 [Bacteroidota bacterium]